MAPGLRDAPRPRHRGLGWTRAAHRMGSRQWSDAGMFLQTVMLLLRAEGLHSCPQMAWSQVRETVAEVLSPSDWLILFCGMSIGYEDPTVSYARTGRAPLDDTVRFVGG